MWFRNMGRGLCRRSNFGCGLRRRQMGFEREMGKYSNPPWCEEQKSGFGKETYGPGWWKRLRNFSNW